MLDPIYAEQLVPDTSCKAHLLPKAIRPNGRTISSHRKFDNEFGKYNDHHLARYINNYLEDETEIIVHVLDPSNRNNRVTSFRTTSCIHHDAESGVRNGTFTDKFSKKTSNEWRLSHLGKGKLVEIEIQEPAYLRIELSMLHSGYLTSCYHLGTSHITGTPTMFIRGILQHSLSDELMPSVENICRILMYARRDLATSSRLKLIQSAIKTALTTDSNPMLLIRLGEDCCFMPILPYHKKFTSYTLLPGLEDDSIDQWINLALHLSDENLPFVVSLLPIPVFPHGTCPIKMYHELARSFREYKPDESRQQI